MATEAQIAWSRRQYAIKNSLGAAEKELIHFYELNYQLKKGYIPTVDEVVTYLKKKYPKITYTSVNYYLKRQPVITALEKRGIPWRQHSQEELTPSQLAAILTASNFADERSLHEKLDELGIAVATYQAWLNDPVFQQAAENKAQQALKNIKPEAINQFTKKIAEGFWPAVKHYLDVTGTIQSNDAPQSEVLIKMLIEIIQEEVKDPEVILRIASRVKQASANRTLEATIRPALTSEIEEDEELEQAKRMVGF